MVKGMIKMKDRNARASAFGWDFQSNLALYFVSKDLKTLSRVKVEGPTEDIELFYNDGRSIFIQAKSQENPYQSSSNTNTHLKNAIKTLIDASLKIDYSLLYYGTNIANPFIYREFNMLFSNGSTDYSFNELPEKIKTKIKKYIEDVSRTEELSLDNFDYNRLRITTLPFYGDDNQTRYRYIKESIEIFLNKLGLSWSQIESIFGYYQLLFTQNPSKKVDIQKEDLAWPIIIYSLDSSSDEFYEEFDLDISDEDAIENIYKDFIEKKSLEFTLLNEVSNHFLSFAMDKTYTSRRSLPKEFIEENHSYYSKKMFLNELNDMSESVTKLILWKIIKKTRTIHKLRKEVGL